MRTCFFALTAALILFSTASPLTVQALPEPHIIEQASLKPGIIHIQLAGASSSKLRKVMIQLGSQKQIFTLPASFENGSFPLAYGSGSYTITVYEQVQDNQYRKLQTEELSVNLPEPNQVFLESIQPIEWNVQQPAIRKASEITAGAATDQEKTERIYRYVTEHFSYDYDKAAEPLPAGYTPDIEATFESETGICYDASALFAAMLRSSGVPVKLVKGYAPNIKEYHAWNEVYLEGKGWITMDVTTDSQYLQAGYSVKPWKDGSLYRPSVFF